MKSGGRALAWIDGMGRGRAGWRDADTTQALESKGAARGWKDAQMVMREKKARMRL